ncbi:glycosyl transferase family 1 [bacterium]|nr:MAG: glycosyl transferase family 1 [bacterium]
MREKYSKVAGKDVIDHLQQLASKIKGLKVVHINSTSQGGGVAEILNKLVPLMCELGIDAKWEVITGTPLFFETTKTFHNSLQGKRIEISEAMISEYERVNRENAEKLSSLLVDADIVFIHDPQPAPILQYCNERKGKWIWRCHIDVSKPYRPIWRYISKFVSGYDASIFSLADFAQRLPNTQYLILPSIDPLSEKNISIPQKEIDKTCQDFGIDRERPIMLQVSRFDRFKDPLGVICAYKLTKKFIPSIQLILAGGGSTDDPEGKIVLSEVQIAAEDDPDIHILLLPPTAHRTINILQRAADIVLQKSIKEGFGLTVTEAMWKGKPVIGGNTGGIRLQVVNHHTGFLVDSPEGAALRTRYLMSHNKKRKEMGLKAKKFVRDNFLLTRHLREYLTLMVGLSYESKGRIELG